MAFDRFLRGVVRARAGRALARGHVKRLYAKLDVHGKQELVDRVEAVEVERRRPGVARP